MTSITTARPGRLQTLLGTFSYRHLQQRLFWGYQEERIEPGQRCFVARPEKALVDLFHLTPGRITPAFVTELRLQGSEGFDFERLRKFAERTGKPKLIHAAAFTADLLRAQSAEEAEL